MSNADRNAENDAQVVLGQIGEHVEPQACRECGKSARACGRSGNFCCAACSRSRFDTHYPTPDTHYPTPDTRVIPPGSTEEKAMTDADLTLRDEVAEVLCRGDGDRQCINYDPDVAGGCSWCTRDADALLPLLARVREEGWERAVDIVRHVHHDGRGRLEPGKWCVADGDVWPCPTIRAMAEATNAPKQALAADSAASEASGVSVDPDEDGRAL